MDPFTNTLYEILGVPRDAKEHDIVRAYRKQRSAMQDDTAPPDPRRAALLQKAHDVLTDPVKRAQYDDELAGKARQLVLSSGKAVGPGKTIAVVAAAVAVVGGAVYAYMRHEPAPDVPALTPEEILASVSPAIGALHSVEVSGRAAQVGVAFAVAPSRMIATCEGVAPGSQLTVRFGRRDAAARIARAEERLGLCELAVDGAGSWPVVVRHAIPRRGDKVFVPRLTPSGEVSIAQGRVEAVVPNEGPHLVDSTVPLTDNAVGTPLLDSDGRVIALATHVDGKLRYRMLPAGWIDRGTPVETPAPPRPAEVEAQDGTVKNPRTVAPPPMVRGTDFSEERKKRLGEAFRPPPTVPDDL